MFRGVGVLWRRKDGCEAVIKGCGGCFVVDCDAAYFSAHHTLLQVCRPVASVLEEGTTYLHG